MSAERNNIIDLDEARRKSGGGSTLVATQCALSDIGNAERFARQHGLDVRFCAEWNKWLVWDNYRWLFDLMGEIGRRAQETARTIYNEKITDVDPEDLYKFARQSSDDKRLSAMIKWARHNEGIAVRANQFDADPNLFNCENGTVDLITGEVHEPRREDLQLKRAPVLYDPEAKCDAWLEFIKAIFDNDEHLIAFVQRAIGYSLCGSTQEEVMFILYGVGANGKSTFIETLQALVGDYGSVAPIETLVARKNNQDSERIFAPLKGVRFLSVSEPGENDKLAIDRIKRMTGGDTLAARLLYGEQFKFQPTFKIFLTTNHPPHLGEVGPAVARRLRMIPFVKRFEGQQVNRQLKQELLKELPGILNWVLAGARDWRANGLGECPAVNTATAKMLAAEDLVARFIEEVCTVGPTCEVGITALYQSFTDWCKDNREYAIKKRAFGDRMRERKFGDRSDGKKRFWTGIALGASEFNGPSQERAREASERTMNDNPDMWTLSRDSENNDDD